MPWKETRAMDERKRFIEMWLTGNYTLSELCAAFGVSRKTGYKWVERFKQGGFPGLAERSRAPLHHPNEISRAVEASLLEMRDKWHWGPDKLLRKVLEQHPDWILPARSSVARLLSRHGLIKQHHPHRKATPTVLPLTNGDEANIVWTIDFKGQFRLGNKRWCYPLTLCDHYSRFLICCQGFSRICSCFVRRLLERVFREYGLPMVIRSDNGPPFASTALAGLTHLNVWWVKLGIQPERIKPGHPEQNGRHERMHRELKAETARVPKSTLGSQQQLFDSFRYVYNHERPHQALDFGYPAQYFSPSPRPFPNRLQTFDYPDEYTIRKVCSAGYIKWDGESIFTSRALSGEPLGMVEVDDGVHEVYFRTLRLGSIDERLRKKGPIRINANR